MLKHSLGHIHRAVVIVAVMLAGMLLLNVGLTPALAQGPGGGSPPAGDPPGGQPPDGATANTVLTAGCGVITIDAEAGQAATDQTYTSTESDISALCVINGVP